MQKTIIILSLFLVPLTAFSHGVDRHIIRMTGKGFEPKEITILHGDEVLFINNDDADRWPASNFHPTHTLYSEFDPQKVIAPGEFWKFKFDKLGTWRMHDHLIPHMTGTITVLVDPDRVATTTEQQGPTLTTPSQGQTLDAPLSFWAKIKSFFLKLFSVKKTAITEDFKYLNEKEKYGYLEELSAREGPEAAWQLILDTYKTPEGVVGNPHDLAHLTGQLIFKKHGFDGLSICTPVFAFGCYHGLMEVAFALPAQAGKENEGGYEKNLLAGQDGCRKLLKEDSPSSETGYWSCIHGIGHGIATSREHNLDLSLKDCDLLGERIRTYCHDGVFMEFSISAPKSFYRKDNPIYPCDTVEDSYKVACARSQSKIMTLDFGLSIGKAAGACQNTGDERIIYHCIDSLGYLISQRNQEDPDEIIYRCKEIKDKKLETQCLAAAAGELVFQDVAGWQELTKKVCKNEITCLQRVEQVKESYGRE